MVVLKLYLHGLLFTYFSKQFKVYIYRIYFEYVRHIKYKSNLYSEFLFLIRIVTVTSCENCYFSCKLVIEYFSAHVGRRGFLLCIIFVVRIYYPNARILNIVYMSTRLNNFLETALLKISDISVTSHIYRERTLNGKFSNT